MKILTLMFLFLSELRSEGSSYSFIIKLHPLKVSVSSPREIAKELAVIVENETLAPVWGKIVDTNGTAVDYLAIPSQQTRSVLLKNFQKDQIYYFVSESPPFQKLPLEFNKKPYQIPPLK
ncbi:MAG: hypothetical protein ACHQYQ_02720 [Bacteriovoracales bacterium]